MSAITKQNATVGTGDFDWWHRRQFGTIVNWKTFGSDVNYQLADIVFQLIVELIVVFSGIPTTAWATTLASLLRCVVGILFASGVLRWMLIARLRLLRFLVAGHGGLLFVRSTPAGSCARGKR